MGPSLCGERTVLWALVSGVGLLCWWELQEDLSSKATPVSLEFFSLVWLVKSKLIRATNPNKTLGSKKQWFYHGTMEQKTDIWCGQFFESRWWRVVPKQGSLRPWLLVSSTCQVEEKGTQKYMLSSQEKSEPTPNIDVGDNSGIKVPFPQTCKELSLVQIQGFPNTEVMFYVFFFSLENFF